MGQIEMALKKNRTMAPHFRGVFARDTLPQNPEEGFYIVNFDRHGQPGSHWICMQIGKSSNSYFDGYGKKVPKFAEAHFHSFLGNKKKIERNSKQLQSEFSTTCSQWCMYCVEKMYGVEYEKHHIPLQIRDAIDERLCHEQFGEKGIWN